MSPRVDGAVDGLLDAGRRRPCNPSRNAHQHPDNRDAYEAAYRRAYLRGCLNSTSKDPT
jgi:hypothetical protein